MFALAGLVHIAFVVLLAGGALKMRDQRWSAMALQSARLVGTGPAAVRRSERLALALAVAEVALGAAGLVISTTRISSTSQWISVAVYMAAAMAYGGFFWFVGRLAAINPNAGCGCFGSASSPPGKAHRWVNGTFATVMTMAAIVASTDRLPTPPSLVNQGAAIIVPHAILVAVGASLAAVTPALLADLAQARRGQAAQQASVPLFALVERRVK